MLCGVGRTGTSSLIRQFQRSGSMRVKAYNREIHYDFSQEEVDFLKLLELWDDLKKKLKPHERVLVEGYERIEIE